MNYEQKYKQALERVRDLMTNQTPPAFDKHLIETVFPELKENEDEKNIKDLIDELKCSLRSANCQNEACNGGHEKRIALLEWSINWLEKQKPNTRKREIDDAYLQGICDAKHEIEKQGEQPTDKVEPKFKVGDWVVSNNDGEVWQIGARYTEEGQRIYLYNVNDVMMSITLDELNNDYHLWTINDANDGDALAFDDDTIVIFKDLYNSSTFHSYCHIEDGIFDISKDDMPDWWEGKGFQPATKEQRDLLFTKMEEAGYEWDADKKELKKIESKFKIEKGKWYICIKDLFDDYMDKAFLKGDMYISTQDESLIPSNSNVPCKVYCPDTYFREWTIRDAKDGDVLLEEETGEPFIYNGNRAIYFSGYFLGAYCGIYNGEFNPYGNMHYWGKNSCPSTKEQRDLLFKKMKEAGYEWSDEKKELKKI